MAKSKVSSAAKAEDHGHAALEAEVAKLKKEVAALKRSLASVSKSSSDPRIDQIIEALKKNEVQNTERRTQVG